MHSLRTLALGAATASFFLVGCAQIPGDHDAHHPETMPVAGTGRPMTMGGGPGANMARMDEQMKSMQAMHERVLQATTPEQRSALMAEHMKVMKQSMAMMGTGPDGMMGQGGMSGMSGMSGMHGGTGMSGSGRVEGDADMHHQMMEKRMQMMQSMMQMMLDSMPPAAAKP